MKKRILIVSVLLIVLTCAFALIVSAEDNVPEVTDTYYLVQNANSEAAIRLGAEGKNLVYAQSLIGSIANASTSAFFGQFENGSHVKIILGENVVTYTTDDNTGILINTPITVTIEYNGFTHAAKGGKYNGFVIRHSGANIRLIGTHGYLADQKADMVLPIIANTNDKITNPDKCNVDVYDPSKVYVWVFDGGVYAENIRGYANEEVFFSQDDDASTDGAVDNVYEFKNCVLSSNGAYSVGLEGRDSGRKIVKVDGGIYKGFKAFTVLSGSYIQNATITDDGIHMDCWSILGQLWVIRNSTISKLSTATGRTHFEIWDSNIAIDKISPGSDGGGGCVVTIYTSPTCEKAGTKVVKTNSKTTTDTEYPTLNPALGHKITIETATGVTWDNYFENGMYCGYCSVCNQDTHEVKGTANPLFVNKGLSFAEYEDSTCQVSQSFKVNKEMTKFLDEGFDYGVIATINKDGGEIAPELNGQKVVSASFVSSDFELFCIKLTSIPAAEKDTAIVFCAYLVNGEDKYYLNDGKTAKTVVGLSYNQVSK